MRYHYVLTVEVPGVGVTTAIEAPRVLVSILTPALAPAADAAARACYALRGAPDPATLGALREAAIDAADAFTYAAAAHFA
ncbi:hypothetical protein ABZ135_36950 [Streptomyces sp. NPDC006339]|uniref:hypothetical protein n=1 Tax=Streptomyces sp. NPDC006339 TaxID=3156755 RepID=UPI0033B6A94A